MLVILLPFEVLNLLFHNLLYAHHFNYYKLFVSVICFIHLSTSDIRKNYQINSSNLLNEMGTPNPIIYVDIYIF